MAQHLLDSTDALVAPASRRGARLFAIAAGALLVAGAAQVSVYMPMNPVPSTLQPVAVLVVGGLLGWRGGALALGTYLAMGLLGLPVFAGGGAGLARVIGPTGGYLLAFPLAAALAGRVGRAVPDAGILRVLLAMALGMVTIHLGGWAQLAALGGDPALAFRLGFVPFLTGDFLKIGLAAGVVLLAGPRLRGLL